MNHHSWWMVGHQPWVIIVIWEVVDLRKIWRWAAAGDYNDMFPAQGSSHLSYKQQPTQTKCYMAGLVDSEWIWSGGFRVGWAGSCWLILMTHFRLPCNARPPALQNLWQLENWGLMASSGKLLLNEKFLRVNVLIQPWFSIGKITTSVMVCQLYRPLPLPSSTI